MPSRSGPRRFRPSPLPFGGAHFRCAHTRRTGKAGLDVGPLEARIMLSANPVIDIVADVDPAEVDASLFPQVVAPDHDAAATITQTETLRVDAPSTDPVWAELAERQSQDATRNLVFVDATADEYRHLLADLLVEPTDRLPFDLVAVDPALDGIEQVTDYLADRNDVQSIHFVLSGDDGGFRLGNAPFDLDSIQAHLARIAAWQDALASDAELVFHVAGPAESAEAHTLVDTFGLITGAHVELRFAETSTVAAGSDAPEEVNASTPQQELVFVDPAAHDYHQLIDALSADDHDGRQFDIVVLESDRDGVEQISQALSRYDDLAAVHVVSHGADGAVKLGNLWLTTDNLATYADRIASWQDALAADADILLYGCDVADSARGQEFVDAIAQLTGADVAASADDTGHATLGGDWVLEYAAGAVETPIAFGIDARIAWAGLLATETVRDEFNAVAYTNNDGTVNWAGDWTETSDDGLANAGNIRVESSKLRLDNLDGGDFESISRAFNLSGATWATLTFDYDGLATGFPDRFAIEVSDDGGLNWSLLEDITAPADTSFSGNRSYDLTTYVTLTANMVVRFSITQGFGTTTQHVNFDNVQITYTSGGANTVIVDTTSDVADAPGYGTGTFGIASLLANRGADGFISLREAIDAANRTANLDASTPDEIHFDIAGAGPHTIAVTSALPGIVDAVIIDGTTDPDHVDAPIIELNGNAAGAGVDGLRLEAGSGGSTIRGLVINRFGDEGIEILTGSNGNTIAGNYIGTDVAGTADQGNTGSGMDVRGTGHTIGGTDSADRNVISGNGGHGIFLVSSTGTEVLGNYIGTDVTGTVDLGNFFNGVSVATGGSGVVIGGTAAGAGNLISGNTDDGIALAVGTSGATVQGNFVGTNAAGAAALANSGDGIEIGGSGHTIGGATAAARNVISGNDTYGVLISGAGATGNFVQGNYIGTNATGDAAVENAFHGVYISNASANTIGGVNAGEGNVISGNAGHGVLIQEFGAYDNVVEGNIIGANAAGDAGVANQQDGVRMFLGAYDNTIGGAAAGAGNLIAYNGGIGVNLFDPAGSGNALLRNAIHSNTGLGIDLDGGTENGFGVTTNDDDDPDTGPNNLQNYPILTAAATDGATTITIDGSLNSTAGTTFRVEFFASTAADASGFGEGETYLDFANVTTDGGGDVTFSEVISAAVPVGRIITATATDPSGNTSEFALSVAAVASAEAPVIDLDADDSSGQTGADFEAAFTEDGGAIAIADADAALSDADNTNLQSLTVTITNLLDGADEVLAADTTGTSITAMYNIPSGTLVLSGNDTVAHYEQVLRTVSYNNTSDNPDTTARAVTFVANDGVLDSNVATTTVTIAAENDGPTVGVPGNQNAVEDAPFVLSVANGNAVSVADVDAGANPVEVSLSVTDGTLTLASISGLAFSEGGGSGHSLITFQGTVANVNTALDGLTFSPDSEFVGLAVLTISIDDLGNTGTGGPQADADAVIINVAAANDAPTIDLDADNSSGETGGDFATTWTEGGGPVAIADTDAVLADIDSPTLTSLIVSLASLWDGANEVLAADTTGTSIIATPGVGTLTLSGVDTVANYQQVLRTITYDNTSASPTTLMRSITFVASDGTDPSPLVRTNLTMVATNDPPTVALANTTTTLPEDTDTTGRIKVADIVVTDDAQGTNVLSLAGADAGMFEIDGTELFLSAGASLDFETRPLLDVTVEVDDTSVGATPDDTAALAINITNANEPPTVSLQNTTTTLPEDTDTTGRIKVADIVVTDDALGTNVLSLVGADAAMFEIDGTELYLSAGATLDFETNPVLDVTVEVDDAGVGGTPDDTAALAIAVTDVNEPPTVNLQNTTNTLSENTDTSSRIKVADIVVTDDALGTNVLSLSGADAAMFEIDAAELYLSAGVTLDFETNPVLDVTVEVDDTAVGATPDDTAAMAITITDGNDPPSVALANTTASLAEDTDTTGRIKVADIVVTDDGLGTNVLSLAGADAAMFEIDGTELYLSAGATLDFETNPALDVTVEVDDAGVGGTPDDTAALAIDITDVNEPPTVSLQNTTNTLAENTDTSSRIKVADIVVADDALGTNVLTLSGADAAMFEIDAAELFLSAGVTLDFATNPVLDVIVEVDDAGVGATPDDTAALAITVTETNDPPTVSLTNTTTSLAEDTDTTGRIKVADIVVTDDALGTNVLSLVGADAGMFEIDGAELYLSAGGTLDFETDPVLDVTVEVDDAAIGGTPDDTAALAISVTDVNEPPAVSLANTATTLAEDTDTTGRIKVADIVVTDDALGANVLTLTGADAGMFEIDGAELYLSAGATLDFETNPTLDVTVEVDDAGVGATPDDTDALAINVTDVNEQPTANDDVYAATEDNALVVAAGAGVLANDTDGDTDPLSATLLAGPSGGTVALAVDGSFTYTPDADFEGVDTFTYEADDGRGGADQATVTVVVAAVNDAPVATGESYTVRTDESLVVAAPGLLANDTDIDGGPLTVTVVAGPASGTLAAGADGSFTYTPDDDFVGADSFTYVVNDGAVDSDVVTVAIEVEAGIGPLPDPPDDGDPPPDEETGDGPEDDATTTENDSSDTDEPIATPSVDPQPPAESNPQIDRRRLQSTADASTASAAAAATFADVSGETMQVDMLSTLAANNEAVARRAAELSGSVRHVAMMEAPFINPAALWQRLDDIGRAIDEGGQLLPYVAGTVTIASLALTAGYVLWTIKGGYLMASMLSSLPAWRFVDPLPILDSAAMAAAKSDEDISPEEAIFS